MSLQQEFRLPVRAPQKAIFSIRAGRFAGALLALMAVAAAPSLRAQVIEEGERLQFADGLYARDMHELALKEYQAFLRDFPGSDKADAAHFRMGETLRQMGDQAGAEEQYTFVFDHCPASKYRPKAGFKRADLYLEKQQWQTAVDLFRALLKENPPEDTAAPAWYFMGTALQKLNNPRETAEAFEQARSRFPSSSYTSYALLALGGIYGQKPEAGSQGPGEEKALECYRSAAENPATGRVGAEALFQMGELFFRRGAFDKSAEAYGRLLSLYPADSRCGEARLQAAWSAHSAGLYAESLRMADDMLKPGGVFARIGDEAEWLYLKAGSQRQMGQYDQAVQAYARLLEEFPACRFARAARYEKALAFYKMQRFQDAVAELGRVELTDDLKKDVYWLYAESYAGLQQAEPAIDYYRRIATQFPAADIAGDATYRLAHLLQAQGNFREAAQFYGAVATNYAQSALVPAALLASGICLAKDGRHDEAVRDWERLIREFPSHAAIEDALYQAAMSEIRLKRDGAAIASLRQLVRQFPKSKLAADACYWEGLLLKEAEKWPEAEAALRKSLASNPSGDLAREAQFHLANVLQKMDKPDEAARIFNGLLASPLRSKFPPAMLAWLAEYSFGQKQYPESVSAARQLVENGREPNWQQIGWGLAGRGELAAGHKEAAIEALQTCVAVKASTRFAAESALRLGDIHWTDGDYTNATAWFGKAAAFATSDGQLEVRARAYAGLGRAAKAAGDFPGAAKYFMSVAILYDDPELVPECLFEAMEAFKRSGRMDDAAKTYKELRQRYPDSKWTKRAPGSP